MRVVFEKLQKMQIVKKIILTAPVSLIIKGHYESKNPFSDVRGSHLIKKWLSVKNDSRMDRGGKNGLPAISTHIAPDMTEYDTPKNGRIVYGFQ